jgi:lactate dehydrogenase-like 2-hydroxyacid dehydrogenase
MQIVRTVSFPEPQLLAKLTPLPEGPRGVLWDLQSEPKDAELGEIDAVVLPYIDAFAVLGSLARVKGLKFVQTQSTGYDGVTEAAGESAGVANASGVHAAATAELAVGLILGVE